MTKPLIDWVRPEFLDRQGYSACKSIDSFGGRHVAKLDANENPYGSCKSAMEAISKIDTLSIYPDATQAEIRAISAKYCGCDPDQIVCGAGSSQLIDYIIKLFVDRDGEMINLVPSFAMYKFFGEVNGINIVNVPRDENFEIDVEALKKAITPKTKLVFIAEPNNPTGNVTPLEIIEEVLKLGIPTVSDEAYYEFTGVTALPLMKKYENLMVLRSYSKFAGLAGLRVGFGIFPKEIADRLHAIRDPYNINVPALAAVKASMANIDTLLANVKAVCDERDRLLVELAKFSWLKVYPSKSNYILCRILNGKPAPQLQKELEEYCILTRCFGGKWLEGCIRFSVGTPEDNDMLLDALKKI